MSTVSADGSKRMADSSVPADSSSGNTAGCSAGGSGLSTSSGGGEDCSSKGAVMVAGGKGKGKAPPQLPRAKLVPAERFKSRRELLK